jgi:hypothetical protein
MYENFLHAKTSPQEQINPTPHPPKKKSFGVQRNVILLFNLLKIMIQTTQDPLEIG